MEALQNLLATPGILQIIIRVAIVLFVVWLAFKILKSIVGFALRIAIVLVVVLVIWYVFAGLPLG
jgi:hypothetical protein